jgi:hypothetical protein
VSRFITIPQHGPHIRFKPTAGSSFSNTKSVSLATDESDTLTRTQGTGTSRRIQTISFWGRIASNGAPSVTNNNGAGDAVTLFDSGGGSVAVFVNGASFAYFLGSATPLSLNTWYHIVVAIDTTQATDSNRVKIYVNGADDTDVAGASFPTQNYDTNWSLNTDVELIQDINAGTASLIDEIARIDGQALTPTSFATSNLPKDISGLTFGSQGWWLRFETGVGSTAGTDSSGNGNTFTSTVEDADFSATVPT